MANPSPVTGSPGIGAPDETQDTTSDSIPRELDALEKELQHHLKQYEKNEFDSASLQETNSKIDKLYSKIQESLEPPHIAQAVAEDPASQRTRRLQQIADVQRKIQDFLKARPGPKPTNGTGSAPS